MAGTVVADTLQAAATSTLLIQTGNGAPTTAISVSPTQNTTFAGNVAVTGTSTFTGNVIGAVKPGTAVNSTSGTSIDFTSIPSTVNRITVMFSGVSRSGTASIQIQLIHSGGTVVTTGYRSSSARFNSTASSETDVTTGILINANNAADDLHGSVVLTKVTGNAWSAFGANTYLDGITLTAGGITLPAVLTGVRITTVNGTDTFDAGTINILYE